MSNIEVLQRHFAAIGSRLRVNGSRFNGTPTVDVSDELGFELRFPGRGPGSEAEVIQAVPADRHLLLLVRTGEEKSKFLCGHDERHWFVAAIPEDARGVTGVDTAKAALQPPLVRALADGLPRKRRFDRRTPVFLRQGEWFFVPEPDLDVEDWEILRDEPLARAGGTPHMLREAFRLGGEAVYVSGTRVITPSEFAHMPWGERRHWVLRVRDPDLFARGTVRHPDHATITLRGWHRVVMNTEQRALAMRHVVFID
jgi:hypothetical protein